MRDEVTPEQSMTRIAREIVAAARGVDMSQLSPEQRRVVIMAQQRIARHDRIEPTKRRRRNATKQSRKRNRRN
jgi:hypothetical protein